MVFMEYRFVQLSIKEGIAWVKVNRPEKRNALCAQMLKELSEIFLGLDTNQDTRVIIFTGIGKTFIAGLDLEEMATMKPPAYMDFGSSMMQAAKKIREVSKPVIGAINGHAFGGGNLMAMACDLIIASENAQFGQQEINVGIFGGAYILPKLVGRCRAAEIVMLGENFSAPHALEMGLINRVVPGDLLEKVAEEMAQKLLAKPPLALKVAKKALLAGFNYDLEIAASYQIALMAVLYGGHDQREGMEAFLAKRSPHFTGE
jgi:enoyl-CoA hydratase/carnithine racemase